MTTSAGVKAQRKWWILIACVVICVLLVVSLLVFVLTRKHDAPQPRPTASTELDKLATLPIKGRAPKTGYDRGKFGPPWTDNNDAPLGHNGCDTRDDILRRDLLSVNVEPRSNCIVFDGVLHDLYSGTTVQFHRGPGTSSLVQIDHMVALLDAWQTGAFGWDDDKRRNFANDPANLQATIRSLNEQKRDGDAATWLPPNKAYRCMYVSRQVDVKATYGLWVTQSEHDKIAEILTACGTASK